MANRKNEKNSGKDDFNRMKRRLEILPKIMELIGLGYSAWFTYRYLLFKVGG